MALIEGLPPDAKAAARARLPKRAPVTIKQVYKYLKAEIGPRLPAAEADQRLQICRRCEHYRCLPDEQEYCDRCGCGARRRAELKTKTRMAWATCPLGEWPNRKEA